MRSFLALLLLTRIALAAEPEFPLTADSQPQPNVPRGTLLKDSYTAKEGSVFPGTQRDYQIYLPAGFDKTKPAAFMVFQDGVIYQAPVVFDNLIAKKDIPPLVGIFIKPGVVPAANDNALPRFNRSYEYDSITPTYSQFLLDEFLPAIEAKHGLKLSTDPNHAAISGNSSGGICAFMAAWHRPDRFRRVFTGVGTYVGIHGADQLPVLVRKFEPKPLRVFLQSGTGDNNLYCCDWWMANQMMERSLTWAGYDVNHAWGEGGHNAKHATQIFPDVIRWLWRDWQTNIEVKANPKGESKWKGYEVVGNGEWKMIASDLDNAWRLASNTSGEVWVSGMKEQVMVAGQGTPRSIVLGKGTQCDGIAATNDGMIACISRMESPSELSYLKSDGTTRNASKNAVPYSFAISHDQMIYAHSLESVVSFRLGNKIQLHFPMKVPQLSVALSPDQTQLYLTPLFASQIRAYQIKKDGSVGRDQKFYELERAYGEIAGAVGLCVDTNGWLYVATTLGIQVCDQAGRVNFIIPAPKQPYDVCFGGKDLSELFIACGDTIYKRPTKAKGVVSGQQPPIKPAPPKL